MYKAWYNHNIYPQIIMLFNKKKSTFTGQLMNSFFPIYHVIMKITVLVIKFL